MRHIKLVERLMLAPFEMAHHHFTISIQTIRCIETFVQASRFVQENSEFITQTWNQRYFYHTWPGEENSSSFCCVRENLFWNNNFYRNVCMYNFRSGRTLAFQYFLSLWICSGESWLLPFRYKRRNVKLVRRRDGLIELMGPEAGLVKFVIDCNALFIDIFNNSVIFRN